MEEHQDTEKLGYGLVTKQAQVSMFLNEQRFEFAQRIGKMLSASTMIPDQFRNNLGNCLIALNLAERLGIDVFGLMQTSYVIHGRPGFEAKLLIALFNSRTQLFIPPLRWEMKGEFPAGQDAGCRAYAIDRETKEPLYGEWIDWPLIKAEGWDSKNGSKWNTIPGQMFRYRAASFFINVYEPGLKMGIHTVDELEDMVIDVTPEPPKIEVKDIEETEPPKDDPYATTDASKTEEEQEPPEKDKPGLPCPRCDFKAKTERGLKKHLTQQHSEDNDPPPVPHQDAQDQKWEEYMDGFLEADEDIYNDTLKKCGYETRHGVPRDERPRVYGEMKAALETKLAEE